jgi:hypothetical protein
MTSLAEHYEPNSAPSGRVDLDGASVKAEVTFYDPEIVEILQQVPEGRRVDFFVRGARGGLIVMGNDMTTKMRDAMRFMQTTLDTQVSSFGDRMVEKVVQQLGDADEDGNLQKRVRVILNDWSTELKDSFAKSLPDVFESHTKKSIEQIEAEGYRTLKKITAIFSEGGVAFNELREVRREFTKGLSDVKETFVVAKTMAANLSPRDAGLDYQAVIHQHLATIGGLRGDDVEDTADKVGKVPNCKKGDTRILLAHDGAEVIAPPCVAIEIRDRKGDEFTLDHLQTMLRNREAQVGLIIASQPGSLPRQYASQPFAISRPKRLITLTLPDDLPGCEVILAAAYSLAAYMALDAVRKTHDGDWAAVARIADAMQNVIEGMVEDQTAFNTIEKKAHDASQKASRRHSELVRLISDLGGIIRAQ